MGDSGSSGSDGEGNSGGKPAPSFHERLGINKEDIKLQIQVMDIQDSCVTKSLLSAGMGGVFGAMFGMFIGSTDSMGQAPLNASYGQSFKDGLRSMGRNALSYGKNFGQAGFFIAGIECGLEKLTAQHSLGNSLAAGCVSGMILSRDGGAAGMGFGCVTFAGFSALFHYLQER